jgi:hypothetical protein
MKPTKEMVKTFKAYQAAKVKASVEREAMDKVDLEILKSDIWLQSPSWGEKDNGA